MKKLLSIILLVSIFSLSACSLFRDEKQDYINAMVEASCTTFNAPDLTAEKIKVDLENIFKKHGFDLTDNEKMKAIGDKYLEDQEVKDAILKGAVECGQDVPGLNKIQPEGSTEKSTIDSTEKPIEVTVPVSPEK